jgi:3-oxoacyl-[acyl-carrier protein] reductase
MDLGIAGRTAIVCASSKGLGRGCAEALAQAGCTVVINGRDGATLEATASAIRAATGATVIAVVADVSTRAGQDALLAAAPNPDILVNNNGGPPPKPFREVTRDGLLDGVVQNMATPLELVQRVVDGMIERRFGRIVNITSASVVTPLTGLDVSSAARAGLTAFLSGVAREVAHANVTINNILPGMFDTDRLKSSTAKMAAMEKTTPEEAASRRKASVPAGRFGTADEFGKLCAFLASAHAGYITGQNFQTGRAGGAGPKSIEEHDALRWIRGLRFARPERQAPLQACLPPEARPHTSRLTGLQSSRFAAPLRHDLRSDGFARDRSSPRAAPLRCPLFSASPSSCCRRWLSR